MAASGVEILHTSGSCCREPCVVFTFQSNTISFMCCTASQRPGCSLMPLFLHVVRGYCHSPWMLFTQLCTCSLHPPNKAEIQYMPCSACMVFGFGDSSRMQLATLQLPKPIRRMLGASAIRNLGLFWTLHLCSRIQLVFRSATTLQFRNCIQNVLSRPSQHPLTPIDSWTWPLAIIAQH